MAVPAHETAIYLVISQSGSWLSKLLKYVTKANYNHVSISLDESMQHMYSFSRKYAYNPVWGGFMKESPFFGSMKRFSGTEAVILRVPVSYEQYDSLEAFLLQMYAERDKYHYNIPGLLLAGLHIVYHQKNWYYCSEFVRDALDRFSILDARLFSPITKPEDFLTLGHLEIIYIGNLRDYAARYDPHTFIEFLAYDMSLPRKMLHEICHLLAKVL